MTLPAYVLPVALVGTGVAALAYVLFSKPAAKPPPPKGAAIQITAAHAPSPSPGYSAAIATPESILARAMSAQAVTGPRQTLSFRPSQFLGGDSISGDPVFQRRALRSRVVAGYFND